MRWLTSIGALCLSSLLASSLGTTAGAQEDASDPPQRSEQSSAQEKVSFNFADENWLNVLQWFADAAGKNLDWQALPEDTLNLTTQQKYTITEALDVINLHLLTRGFTLLSRDDVLFLVKLDENLNPALVPRVAPEELDERGKYEYCKISFALEWMLAEVAVEELEPMLSPHGRITPLSTTNRIEVLDAAVNLREIRDLLEREQSGNSEERLVEEFALKHARAAEVLEQLHQILGLETPISRMTRDQMRMAEEQFEYKAEMLKRLGDKASIKQNDGVYLIANERKNSILANAPPDKIAVIRQAVLALDVAPNNAIDLAELTTMKVYPLNGAEADAVVDILEDLRDIGKLHPSARFSEDDDRQILFAYASIKDHLTIDSVMEQLAGSARTFKVIPLTRLRAAYVADAIGSLMGGSEGSGNDGGDRRDRYRRRSSRDSSWRGFRVEADSPNNRLFLFATAAELKQVEELLVKIGERPGGLAVQSDQKIRVVDASGDTAEHVIEQLRTLWPSVGANPLRIQVPQERSPVEGSSLRQRNFEGEQESDPSTSVRQDEADLSAGMQRMPAFNADAGARRIFDRDLAFASLLQAGGDEVRQQPSQTSQGAAASEGGPAARDAARRTMPEPPVTVRQSANGQLILSSEDTAALDQMEHLLRELMPERRPFNVFRLQYASPFSVQLTLEEIFASDSVRATAPVTFVSDETTQSIMVFGAGNRELTEIEELIRFYDQPPPQNPESVREPRFYDLQYANAESAANVLKEIYRDLLSPNDKSLAQNRENSQRDRAAYTPAITAVDNKPRYAGMLSIGVFPETNSLIVSAPGFLAAEIAETIQNLDSPTAPTVTQVMVLDGGVNATAVAERLSALVTKPEEPQRDEGDQRNRNDRDRADRERESRNDRDQRRRDADFRTPGGDVRGPRSPDGASSLRPNR